jgi:hypothetical protein
MPTFSPLFLAWIYWFVSGHVSYDLTLREVAYFCHRQIWRTDVVAIESMSYRNS